jgi:hypothetical protein
MDTYFPTEITDKIEYIYTEINTSNKVSFSILKTRLYMKYHVSSTTYISFKFTFDGKWFYIEKECLRKQEGELYWKIVKRFSKRQLCNSNEELLSYILEKF